MKSAAGFLVSLTALVVCGLPLLSAQAEVLDFGGVAEKFKGAGDKEPPQCQVDIPRATEEPFFIKWNCQDNWSNSDNITSELWIYRKDSDIGVKIGTFLGFPASVLIDETILQVEEFTDGLPVGFRLLARDRAGISTLTGLLVVTSQEITLNSCDLDMLSKATEATGGTTGEPAKSVNTNDTSVSSQQLSSSQVRVFTSEADQASPCEISSVCEDGDNLKFDVSLTLDSSNNASGTILITPGSVAATVSGTAEVSNNSVTSFSVSGSTSIDGVDTDIDLACKK
jgi:hypothetical protein